jgi:hypothetical protein
VREVLLGKLVLVLSRATPEKLAAIYGFATGEQLESADCGLRIAELKRSPAEGSSRESAESRVRSAEWKNESPRGSADCGMRSAELPGGPAYVFRWTGRDWEIVFGRGRAFHLEDTLGVRYVHYLLHHPNEAIAAFDLEVIIQPEKGEARSRNSIQPESDGPAKRQYAEALRSLQLERQQARKAGDRAKVAELDGDIKRLNAALREHGGMSDAGERARNNVRHAVKAIKVQLQAGSPEEQALAEHLERHLTTGIECYYSQPQGRIWESEV